MARIKIIFSTNNYRFLIIFKVKGNFNIIHFMQYINIKNIINTQVNSDFDRKVSIEKIVNGLTSNFKLLRNAMNNHLFFEVASC